MLPIINSILNLVSSFISESTQRSNYYSVSPFQFNCTVVDWKLVIIGYIPQTVTLLQQVWLEFNAFLFLSFFLLKQIIVKIYPKFLLIYIEKQLYCTSLICV